MVFDRARRQVQRLGDLSTRLPGRNQVRDLSLTT
jgi:hypothetical protein